MPTEQPATGEGGVAVEGTTPPDNYRSTIRQLYQGADSSPEPSTLDTFGAATIGAVAEGGTAVAQDFARPLDYLGEKVGVDVWDDRWYEGRFSDRPQTMAGSFVREGTRFAVEAALTGGVLRAGTAAAAGAEGAAALAKSQGLLKTIRGTVSGADKALNALRLGEYAAVQASVGVLQRGENNLGIASSLTGMDPKGTLGQAVDSTVENVAFDVVLGGVGRILKKGWARAAARADSLKAVAGDLPLSDPESAKETIAAVVGLSDTQLREAADQGLLDQGLVNTVIGSKYEVGDPRLQFGKNWEGYSNSVVLATQKARLSRSVVEAHLRVEEAFAKVWAQANGKGVDDYFGARSVEFAGSGEVRGKTDWYSDGRAVIKLFRTADRSTLFHESAHIFRKRLHELGNGLSEAANKWVGATDSNWTPVQEEAWAISFERYLGSESGPTKELEGIFELTKKWLIDAYKGVINSPLNGKLSPEIKSVFDRMLGGESVDILPATTPAKALSDSVKESLSQGATLIGSLNQGMRKHVNYDHIKSTDDVVALLKSVEDLTDADISRIASKPTTLAEIAKSAQSMGIESEIVEALKSTSASTRRLAVTLIAGKTLRSNILGSVAEKAKRLLEIDARGAITAEHGLIRDEIKALTKKAEQVNTYTATIQAEAARATGAGRIDINGATLSPEQEQRLLSIANGTDPDSIAIKQAAEAAAKEGDETLAKALDELDAGQGSGGDVPNGPVGADAGVAGNAPPSGGSPSGGSSGKGGASGRSSNGPSAAGGGNGTAASVPGQTANVGVGGANGRLGPATHRYLTALVAAANNGNQAPRIHQQATNAAKHGVLGAFLEFYISSILSGLRTFNTNLLGNTIQMGYQPAAKAAGHLVNAAGSTLRLRGWAMTKAELANSADSMAMYIDIGHALSSMIGYGRVKGGDFHGFRAVISAFNKESSWLGRGIEGSTGPAIAAPTFGLKNSSVAGKGVNAAGKVIRTPLRALTATDEFFSQVNYLAYVRRDSIKWARQQVQHLPPVQQGQAMQRLVEARIAQAFDKGAAASTVDGKPLFDEAYRFQQDATYKTPLEFGIGGWLTEGKTKHPWLGFIFPFVKTVVNITRSTLRGLPGYGVAQYNIEKAWGNLSPDQLTRRKGEVALGAAFWGLATYLAANGRLTGGGPTNPEEQKLLRASGWQPYSYAVEGEDGSISYVSYARIEPFGSALGIAADIPDIAGYAKDGEIDKIATGLLQSFTSNLTSKTYLSGITDASKAFTDPKYLPKYLENRAASMAVPNFLAQAAGAEDESLREARGLVDAIKRRIPGLSRDLPPRRNILGEPIVPPAGYVPFVDPANGAHESMGARMLSPAALSRRSSDSVVNELAALQHGISQPPKTIDGNIDLTLFKTEDGQEAYDRWIEITGEIAPGGVNLHDALERLVSSESYQRLPYPEGSTDTFNPRLKAVQRVLGRYREAARRQMISESPDVQEAMGANRERKAERMSSGELLLDALKR